MRSRGERFRNARRKSGATLGLVDLTPIPEHFRQQWARALRTVLRLPAENQSLAQRLAFFGHREKASSGLHAQETLNVVYTR